MNQTSTQYQNFHKTRIAPTPSGFLHFGNILSFAVTAFIARETGARILLRIDDIDRLRTNQEYVQDIFDTLNFLQIPWDEGPRNTDEFEDRYSQVHRISQYNKAIENLRVNGLLYACNCSRKQLHEHNPVGIHHCNCREHQIPLSTENVNWRLIADNNQVSVKKLSGEVIKTDLPAEMHNVIIRKKDGMPSYQLTSVVDDLFLGIDLVIRGEDLWTSTLVQHQLATALGEDKFSKIAFYHHPLLMEAPGKKLSKSAGATSIRYLRQSGHSAAGVYKAIADTMGINGPVINWKELGEAALRAIK
ncbi:glutamate--tRNA ligase family protein [Mucilaginibacter sp. X4EP1]|uniref:glutamate--tRNA ligase family protein n=1 Tax=Mucilaginibacter sp. X4EP1 TaxID=2723092 RepID=UPI002168B039|nr:glutamate--tRNA ligase family protein [Mucilaginibacter sp. X4EP1]MCS3815029.1 glutamyl-tRNA synthetase [Mucilaginibacter sp. X4EP1]